MQQTDNADRAEETVQESMFRAWLYLEQLDDPDRADRWLFSIALNLLRTPVRSISEPLPSEEELPVCESAEDTVIKTAALEDLICHLHALPPRQRQAVYGCFILGLRPAQLAELLKETPHTISARLYRGLRTLRKKQKAFR